jgi:uncharacterized protein
MLRKLIFQQTPPNSSYYMQRFLTVLSVLGLALASALSGVFILRPGISKAYSSPGKPTGFVNDFAGVLDDEGERVLGEELAQFRATTSNELVVVTVNDLGGDVIENYANELFRDWGIGDEERNNGVLLLVAVNDRKVRIEVGYGLEGAITDLESGRIVDGVLLPAFRTGDYLGGIRTSVSTLKVAAEGEYSAPVQQSSTNKASGIGDLLFYSVFGLVWLGSFLARSKSWWAGGVIGAIVAFIVFFVADSTVIKVIVSVLAPTLGLFLDWLVSKNYKKNIDRGGTGGFFGTYGGFSGGSSGGGFGGFSGGSSGGGGSSGSW